MSRIALLIRTHVLDDQVRAFVETMRRDPEFDLFAVVDECRGRIDFGDIPKIPLISDLPAELGLYGQAPNQFWRCGDYALYAARRMLPHYRAFWMIEPDVRINSSRPMGVLDRFPPPEEVDFLAGHLRPAEPDWNWGHTMDAAEGPIWRCLYSLIRISARAIDVLLAERQEASRRFEEGGRDPEWWPNDEVFTASTLARRGLACRDFNDFGEIYDGVGFSYWLPVSEHDLASSGREGWLYHPVLSGQRYFIKLFRIASQQGTLDRLDRVIDALIGTEWTEEEAVSHHRALEFARAQLRLDSDPTRLRA